MGQFRRLLTAIGLGVGAMYFFDPQLGKARRAKLRDQLNTQLNQTRKDAEAKLADLRNRAYGTYRELTSSVQSGNQKTAAQDRERFEEPAAKS